MCGATVSLAPHVRSRSSSAKAVCLEPPSLGQLDPHNFRNFSRITQHWRESRVAVIIFPLLDKVFKQQIKQRKHLYFHKSEEEVVFGTFRSCQQFSFFFFFWVVKWERVWEHLASTWTLRAHTYTPVVSDGQRRLLAQPEQIVLQALELTEAQMSARTHAHAHTHPHTHSVSQSLSGGPASKSSFPEGFDHAFRSIWQKHQQTPSGVKDFLSSFFLFPPPPVFLKHRYASCSLPLLPAQPNYLPLLFWCSCVVWRSSYSTVTLISSLLSGAKVSDDSRLSLQLDFNVPREFCMGLKMPGAITHVQPWHNSSNQNTKHSIN